MHPPKIFISATSGDLGSVRQVVKECLLTINCHPVEQSNFEPDARTVEGMLRGKIGNCQALIHICGMRYGAEPDVSSLPPGTPRRSYTQLEYHIARQLQEERGDEHFRVYTFICPKDFPYDSEQDVEPEEKRDLQLAYRARLFDDPHLREKPKTPDDLKLRILALQEEVLGLKQEQTAVKTEVLKSRRLGLKAFVIVLILLSGIYGGIHFLQRGQSEVIGTTGSIDRKSDDLIERSEGLRLQGEGIDAKAEGIKGTAEEISDRTKGIDGKVDGISNEVGGSRERMERLNFTNEAKLALDRLESALEARDLTERGQTRALEFLLTEDGRYAGADFDGVTLSSGRFTGADFSKCSFRDADLSGVVLSGGKLDGANLTFGTYEDANFDNVSARLVLFELSSGKGASFRDADLTQSSFHFADLRGADFSGAKLDTTNFSFCDLRGAKFTGADLADAIVYQNILTEADFKNAIIKNTIFSSNQGDTAMFTEAQRSEMRRCSLRRDFMTVKVFDQPPPNMHWDNAINSYDLSGFNKIYENTSLSMSMRTLTKFHPRGTMGYYSEHLGHEINTRVHFEGSKFLSIGGRENRLEARLEAHASKLAEVFTLDGVNWIEGLGHEQKAWVKELEVKVTNTATPPNLLLNEDSEFVIALAYGLERTPEAELDKWGTSAYNRISVDKRTVADASADSWGRFFPATSLESNLIEHMVSSYRDWTLGRVRDLKIQKLVSVYSVKYHDLKEWPMERGKSGSFIRPFNGDSANSYLAQGIGQDIPKYIYKPIAIDSGGERSHESIIGISRQRTGPRYIVFPHPRKDYCLPMSNEKIKAILLECEKGEGRSIEMRVTGRHDQVAILSKVETTLTPIEPGKNPPDGDAVYLMTPEAVEFRVGNKSFQSDDLFVSKSEND